MDKPELPSPRDAFDNKILADIQRHGWSVVGIPEDEGPGYTYSVGMFRSIQKPELIIMGMPLPVAYPLVNELCERIRKGFTLETGVKLRGIVKDREVVAVRVDSRYLKEYLSYCSWVQGDATYQAVQIVTPDHKGLFPWEPKYDPYGFQTQRVLGPKERFPHGWPFPDAPESPAFTGRAIVKDRQPILRVVRDVDGAWQFHNSLDVDSGDLVSTLEEIVRIDPTLTEIASLHCGETAFRREAWEQWERQRD